MPMDALHVGHAAAHTGWSARMLRYLEQAGLVVVQAAELVVSTAHKAKVGEP